MSGKNSPTDDRPKSEIEDEDVSINEDNKNEANAESINDLPEKSKVTHVKIAVASLSLDNVDESASVETPNATQGIFYRL